LGTNRKGNASALYILNKSRRKRKKSSAAKREMARDSTLRWVKPLRKKLLEVKEGEGSVGESKRSHCRGKELCSRATRGKGRNDDSTELYAGSNA